MASCENQQLSLVSVLFLIHFDYLQLTDILKYLEWKIKKYVINKQNITLSLFDHTNILLHLNWLYANIYWKRLSKRYATHEDLWKFEDTQEIGLIKTKSSTLKDYKIIYPSYFNISFQNTNLMQLVYYSFLFLYVYTQLQKRCHRKMKKGKSQIGINSANLATFSWWIHLQPLHFPAGIFSFIVFQL